MKNKVAVQKRKEERNIYIYTRIIKKRESLLDLVTSCVGTVF